MRAAIGDATTCPHGHPIVEGAREQGSLLADVEVGADVHVLRFENEAEELLHYLKAAGLEPGLEGTARELRRGGRDDLLRRRLPPRLAQRRRDGLGPRRPVAAAARRDPRAARPLQRPLRPVADGCKSSPGGVLVAPAEHASLPRPSRSRFSPSPWGTMSVRAAALRLAGDHHRFHSVYVGDHRHRPPILVGDEEAAGPFDFAFALAPRPRGPCPRASRRRWRGARSRSRLPSPASRSPRATCRRRPWSSPPSPESPPRIA